MTSPWFLQCAILGWITTRNRMDIYDSHRKPIWLGLPVGHGGEATVYRVRGQADHLAKIYEGPALPEYGKKLVWMRDHPPEDPTLEVGHASLAWPVDLLYDAQGKLAGYLMPYIRDAAPLLEVFNPRRRAITLPEFDRRYLYRAARNLAVSLQALHERGYVVGDLNESNVLVTPSALVTLIDTDSFQVQEQKGRRVIVYRCPVAKLEYTPPELQRQTPGKFFRRPEHDAFGLGVLIFQLLMEGSHPYRARWLGEGDPPPVEERIRMGCFPYMASPPCPLAPPPNAYPLDILHPRLAELFSRCFVDGSKRPERRPKPLEWSQAIAAAEKNLVMCQNGHYFSAHVKECPECLRQQGVILAPQITPRPRRPVPSVTMLQAMFQQMTPSVSSSSSPVSISAVPSSVTVIPVPARIPVPDWRGILKSLRSGALLGAAMGALSAGAAAAIAWGLSSTIAWGTLWGIGGGAAGSLPGWKLGAGTGKVIRQRVGWNLFWQLIGTVSGIAAGGFFGWYLGHSFLPILSGLILGATGGLVLGQQIWQIGVQVGWVRLWTFVGVMVGGWLGWTFSALLSAEGFGSYVAELVGNLAFWLANHSISLALVLTLHGAIGGAIGGAISGAFLSLATRLFGIKD